MTENNKPLSAAGSHLQPARLQPGRPPLDTPDWGIETRPNSWIDTGQHSPAYGLPGRVQLAPAVWLCCVYLSSLDAERVDANCESVRLDALLRTAADAWQRHQRAAGATSCVFPFQPDASGDRAIRRNSPLFLIRVHIDTGDDDDTLVRLEFAG